MPRQTKTVTILSAIALAATLLTYSVLLAEQNTIRVIAAREALLEQVGALLFLSAAVLSFLTFWTIGRMPRLERPSRASVHFLIAVFFLVAFGEEISWGTHAISRQDRAEMFPANIQNEFNVHNLTVFDEYTESGQRKSGIASLVTANRLFDYFMFGSFILIPFVCSRFSAPREWFARLGIPVLPGALSVGLITNWILTVVSEIMVVDSGFMHGAVSEIREFNYSLLCFVAVLFLHFASKSAAEESQVQI